MAISAYDYRGQILEWFETDFKDSAKSTTKTQRLEDEVVSTGYNMLFSAIAGLPASLVSRLKLKLPKSLCDLCVSAPLRLKERPSQTNLSAVLKLFKLKFPEAYKLCC